MYLVQQQHYPQGVTLEYRVRSIVVRATNNGANSMKLILLSSALLFSSFLLSSFTGAGIIRQYSYPCWKNNQLQRLTFVSYIKV